MAEEEGTGVSSCMDQTWSRMSERSGSEACSSNADPTPDPESRSPEEGEECE